MNRRQLLSALLMVISPVVLFAAKGKGETITITIKGGAYNPATVSVKTGDTVVWVNADERDHTVAASDRSFNSGNIGPGGSFSFRFTKPGKFGFSCTLHPRMKGAVNVQ